MPVGGYLSVAVCFPFADGDGQRQQKDLAVVEIISDEKEEPSRLGQRRTQLSDQVEKQRETLLCRGTSSGMGSDPERFGELLDVPSGDHFLRRETNAEVGGVNLGNEKLAAFCKLEHDGAGK